MHQTLIKSMRSATNRVGFEKSVSPLVFVLETEKADSEEPTLDTRARRLL